MTTPLESGDTTTMEVAAPPSRSSRARDALRAAYQNRHVRRAGWWLLLAFGAVVGAEALRRGVTTGPQEVRADEDTATSQPPVPDEDVAYRVTWKSFEPVDDALGPKFTMHDHEQVFTNIDWAWDLYQDMRKSANAVGATYEHVHRDRSE